MSNKIDSEKTKTYSNQKDKPKENDGLLKAVREEKTPKYKENYIRITTDLSYEMIQSKNNIFKLLNKKCFQLRVCYSANLTFIWEEEIKAFLYPPQKMTTFAITKSTLYEILKDHFLL